MNTQKTDTILLSIHPAHVKNILCGIKRFELRRRIPTDIKRIVIYATAPESRIVAIADVESILSDEPTALWEKVCGAAGVEHDFFQHYFRGCEQAFALRIGRIQKIDRKIELTHPMLRISPPQSFCYINNDKVKWLLDCAEQMLSGGTKKIFVGGVHASGKSFLCEQIISTYGYHCVTASNLIKDGHGEISLDKAVPNIEENQNCLLNGLNNIQRTNTHLAIDGHFCLLDKQGYVTQIPFNTFTMINPAMIILTNPPVNVVRERLESRGIPLHIRGSIDNFMKKELKYAKLIAKELSVELEIIDTSATKDELHKAIASIIRNQDATCQDYLQVQAEVEKKQ
jgi:adenylate kinase